MPLPANPHLIVRDLGRIGYADALALQQEAHARVVAGRDTAGEPMTLFLLEHDPPVITVSRRPDAAKHLVATREILAREGVTVAETDRGGDITYHGPGQLVAYPIFDLNRLGLRIHSYMRFLEAVVIAAIADCGVSGDRDSCATGVWVGGRKICAMGVRVSRWVTLHGLALNVSTDLRHFDLIVPCGLAGREVTSLAKELGSSAPSMAAVKARLTHHFSREVERLLLADGP
ncbi:MAG: lipoyl(octanoyl) transferase LipB [Phycisphaerae bacterium]|nr:lipoyl(octanoyl) transferase LipB [Phycisphaerae bacterium]